VAPLGLALSLSLAMVLGLAVPTRAHAELPRDVKAVLTTSLYGLVGGTVMGVASYPLTGDPKSIFVGSSLGLYLGIGVGIYYILNRDDPNNPLVTPPPPGAIPLEKSEVGTETPPLILVKVPVLRF